MAGSQLQDMAHQIASADADGFKIALVSNGHDAGILKELLVRAGVAKNDIAELGYTASDDQNATLLRSQKPVVIVPKPIADHRPCHFHPPAGAAKAIVFEVCDGEAESCEFRWNSIPFTIDELALDFSDLGMASADDSVKPWRDFGDAAYPELGKKSWWQFWK